jgi:hypothetical protein
MSIQDSTNPRDDDIKGDTSKDRAKTAETPDERRPEVQEKQANDIDQDSNQSAHAVAEQFSQLDDQFSLDQFKSKSVDSGLAHTFDDQLFSTPDSHKVVSPITATGSALSGLRIGTPHTAVAPPFQLRIIKPHASSIHGLSPRTSK